MEFLLEIIYKALQEIQVTEQVAEQVGKLMSIMGDSEYATKELMEMLNIKHRATFRDNYLLPALKKGYIQMTVPEKPKGFFYQKFLIHNS